MSRMKELLALQNSDCQDCELASLRTKIVPGRGGLKAKILGIGEAPGKQEDLDGRAFVGPAGQLLNEFMERAGIDTRKDIFLTNTVMCRPKSRDYDNKENRPPSPEEIKACSPKLNRIVNLFNPRLIVLFGVPALKTCLPTAPKRMGAVAGKFFSSKMHIFDVDADVYVMYHPSFVLRYPTAKKQYTSDFARLKHYALGAEILS